MMAVGMAMLKQSKRRHGRDCYRSRLRDTVTLTSRQPRDGSPHRTAFSSLACCARGRRWRRGLRSLAGKGKLGCGQDKRTR